MIDRQLERLVGVLCLATAGLCAAAPGDVDSNLTADNRVANSATHLSGAWVTGTAGINGGPSASRTFDQRAPGGRSVSNTINYRLTPYGTLTIGARALMTLPYVAVGWAIWDIYDAIRVRPDGAGGLAFDPGVEPTQSLDFIFYGPNWSTGPGYPTFDPVAVHNQDPSITYDGFMQLTWGAAQMTGLTDPSSCQVPAHVDGASPTTCRTMSTRRDATCLYIAGPTSGQSCAPRTVTRNHQGVAVETMVCPVGSVGWDSRCGTGSYTQPMTAQEAADMLTASQTIQNLDYQALLNEALGRGPMLIPSGSAVEVGNTVAAIDGGTETTYHPDGSRTEKKTEYLFQRDPISLGNGRYTSRFTTTTYGADGNPTGPPTINEPNPDAPSQDDPCAIDPSRLMCQGMGQVEDPGLQTENRQVDFTPDSGFGSSSDTCPAPPQLALSFGSVTFDNTILCDWLLYVRALLVTVSGMVAAGIIIGGFRT